MGQLTHHRKNWDTLPTTISNRIDDLIQDIHPPLTNELLTAQISEHAKIFGNKIKETINQHLNSELSNITNALNNLNPSDVKEASKLAHTRLRTRLGHKFHRHSLNFSTFEKEVGKLYNTNGIADVCTNRRGSRNETDTYDSANAASNIILNANVSTATLNTINVSNTTLNTISSTISRLDTISLMDTTNHASTVTINVLPTPRMSCIETDTASNLICDNPVSTNITTLSTISNTVSSTISNTVSRPHTNTVMDTTSSTSTVTTTVLSTPIASCIDPHSKVIFNIPVANKYDVLSLSSIDECNLVIPDSLPDSGTLDTPSRKRPRCNNSPETINLSIRNDIRPIQGVNTISSDSASLITLSTSSSPKRFKKTDLNSLLLAKSDDTVNSKFNCNSDIISSVTQPFPTLDNDANLSAAPNALIKSLHSDIDSPSIDNYNTATNIDKPLCSNTVASYSNISNETGGDNIIQSFSTVDNTASALDKPLDSNTAANYSNISNDTGGDNLIQSFSSVDNSAGISEHLIQSFSSVDDTDASCIEQGEFFLFADKKQAHIKLQATTKVLVIGDSNLRLIDNEKQKGRIPKNWTINCIPGANLSLINKLLLELPKKTPMLTDIIISAGMCDNSNTSSHLTTTLNTAISLKKRIHFQGIIVNDKILSDIQVKNLTKINNNAKQHANVLYIKPPKTFSTTPDGIHYLAETVERIFYSMKIHIQHSKSLN